MFDEHMIEEYRSVAAPEELKSRIYDEIAAEKAENKYRSLYNFNRAVLCVAAAALVFLIANSSIRYMNMAPHIGIFGNINAAEPMTARMSEANMAQNIIPIWLTCDYTATIKVNMGQLHVYDSENTSSIYEGTEFEGKGSYLLQWEIADGDLEKYEINVSAFMKNDTYSLAIEDGILVLKDKN